MTFVKQGNGTSPWLREPGFTNKRPYSEKPLILAGALECKVTIFQEMPMPSDSVAQRECRPGTDAECRVGDKAISLQTF
jgi:hypothetical protein